MKVHKIKSPTGSEVEVVEKNGVFSVAVPIYDTYNHEDKVRELEADYALHRVMFEQETLNSYRAKTEHNRNAAKQPRPNARRAPTKTKLLEFIQDLGGYDAKTNPRPRGWRKQAAFHFNVSETTISKVINS